MCEVCVRCTCVREIRVCVCDMQDRKSCVRGGGVKMSDRQKSKRGRREKTEAHGMYVCVFVCVLSSVCPRACEDTRMTENSRGRRGREVCGVVCVCVWFVCGVCVGCVSMCVVCVCVCGVCGVWVCMWVCVCMCVVCMCVLVCVCVVCVVRALTSL